MTPINLNELFPSEELQVKMDDSLQKVEDGEVTVGEWWNGLSPLEQMNPVKFARYNTVNRNQETAGNLLNILNATLNDGASAIVQYSLKKDPRIYGTS